MIKFIQRGHAFDLHKGSGFQAAQQLFYEIIFHKQLHRHGIRKIRHVKHDDTPFIPNLPAVSLQYLSPDGNLSHFADNVLYGNGFVLELPPVQDIRVIGLLQGTAVVTVSAEFAALEITLALETARMPETAVRGLACSSAPGHISSGRIALFPSRIRGSRPVLPIAAGRHVSVPAVPGIPAIALRLSRTALASDAFPAAPGLSAAVFRICGIQLCPQAYLIHAHLNLQFIIPRILAGSRFPVGNRHPRTQAAALHQDLLQYPDQFRLLAPVGYGILQRKPDSPGFRV